MKQIKNLRNRVHPRFSRREILELSGLGFGGLALACLIGEEQLLGETSSAKSISASLKPQTVHFAGSAQAVIQLMQVGGPSQMDMFDPKTELTKRSGQPHPQGVETSQLTNTNTLMGSPFRFRHYGESGMEFSEVIPHLASVADELCLVRSMYTEHNNHIEGLSMIQTCKVFPGRPTMGAWISYALGAENQNLPAYVVLRDPEGYNTGGRMNWTSGFLPALYQGVEFSSSGSPVRHLSPAQTRPAGAQREDLDLLAKLNAAHRREHPGERELESRIQNYELAARMQLAAPGVLDFSGESEATRKLYGLDNPMTAGYGIRCLMARRLVEAGVRFVQVFPPLDPQAQPWDTHGNLKSELQTISAHTDQPFAGLIRDLKGRGLLGSTVVMWTGEFGRLPVSQNGDGRDHNRHGFSLVMAGGGFKKGFVHGETDEFGYKAVVDRVSVPDLHATILYCLGLDHTRVTYKHHGTDEIPTDAKVNDARVVSGLLESRLSEKLSS